MAEQTSSRSESVCTKGLYLVPSSFSWYLDVISGNFRTGLPWERLSADGLLVVADSEEELQRRWLRWQIGMESKGLKVNTKKTEVMASCRRDVEVNIKDKDNARLKQVQEFKYLGVTLDARGGSQVAMRARVAAAWNKWRELSGVISDRKMPRKLKLYSTIIRPVLLYEPEVWTMGKKERILEATEMRMLRRTKGVTLRERERSTDFRRELGVNGINEKFKEMRMRWYGHVKRREGHPAKVAMECVAPGRSPRGRPKKRWRDNGKEDMSHFGVRPE
ncbi:uncharacterized protein LOC134770009 [Penaeus indicus]|uniref:uncharacterized protein LOC134770009 n=1 Tax=Penaeus indicus TaxID=29960 RepID=UPI00300CCE95